jgi:3-dehydroquinate dehydratase type I
MASHGSAALSVALPSRICVSIGEASPGELLRRAHAEAFAGERLFEFCLEFLRDPHEGPGVVREFVRRWPDAWVIVTCRKDERYFYEPVDRQLALLAASVDAGARVVDLEIETAAHALPWMHQVGEHCLRIVSYHNYHAAPPLAPILRSLESVPADIIKVAVAAQDAQTVCSLIEQARKYPRPAIFLAMGLCGLPTRILGPYAGRSFTYGSRSSAAATATGQLDIQTLRETYRLDQVSSAAAFIAGFPSPANEFADSVEYNKRLARAGVSMMYVPWPGVGTIPPSLLNPAMQTRGMALHHRFASQAFTLADQVALEAKSAGIIDTLWKHRERWHAGWKLGEAILKSLRTTSSPGACVSGGDPPQQEAVEKLLKSHGYSVADYSNAQVSVDLAKMEIGYLGGTHKVNLRKEAMQRQMECWL